jgi:hypothetical protein
MGVKCKFGTCHTSRCVKSLSPVTAKKTISGCHAAAMTYIKLLRSNLESMIISVLIYIKGLKDIKRMFCTQLQQYGIITKNWH